MHIRVLSPEALLLDTESPQVLLRTPVGEMGVLDRHAASVGLCLPGPLRYQEHGEWKELQIKGGTYEIRSSQLLVFTA